jgi:hypothetical protein
MANSTQQPAGAISTCWSSCCGYGCKLPAHLLPATAAGIPFAPARQQICWRNCHLMQLPHNLGSTDAPADLLDDLASAAADDNRLIADCHKTHFLHE